MHDWLPWQERLVSMPRQYNYLKLEAQPIRVHGSLPLHEFRVAVANITASLKAPKGYHLTDNNCEQTLNRVLGKPAVSPQLQFWSVAALLAAACALLASRN